MANPLKRNQYYSLTDQSTLQMVAAPVKQDRVLEVGGGKGQLTKFLQKPWVSQIHPPFCQLLRPLATQITPPIQRLTPAYLHQRRITAITGNLPYRYTRTVLQLALATSVEKISIIVQYQVGLRLLQSTMNRLKLRVTNDYQVTAHRRVSAKLFSPTPPVAGMWLLLIKRPKPILAIGDLWKLYLYPRKRLKRIYKLLNWPCQAYETLRPGQLTMANLTQLARLLGNR